MNKNFYINNYAKVVIEFNCINLLKTIKLFKNMF